ncbi:hypothetical protein SBF1_4460003 [Candidatus Desulfosporosinus infrequens]|uniref:Uncharacterized protein n=1 Tax=Candidatus Desulfosporosinus infrequens TaxID=2043169 RepID=A0A2U3LBN0_9FIRM|nr:hypothetical protein SBF1_4460003 [Candidatus Desulfosporosinus infrequens]
MDADELYPGPNPELCNEGLYNPGSSNHNPSYASSIGVFLCPDLRGGEQGTQQVMRSLNERSWRVWVNKKNSIQGWPF